MLLSAMLIAGPVDAASPTGTASRAAHSRAVCKAAGAACGLLAVADAKGHVRHFDAPTNKAYDTYGDVGYFPADLHKAYNLPWNSGVRQTIAVVDAYDHPSAKANLDVFNTQFGLGSFPTCSSTITTACFQRIDQAGNNRGFVNADAKLAAAWDGETDLDVQAAHAMCLNCKILLVEAYSQSRADLAAAVNRAAANGATEISNSYGWRESATSDWYPSAYNHAGIAITVSTGDYGYGPYYPADLNTVVAVGGTRLVTSSDGSYSSETAWGNGVNAPSGKGAGSGCSTFSSNYTSAPYWQSQYIGNWKYTGCGGQRSISDVSAIADPATGFWIYTTVGGRGTWEIIGGTSLSAPVIAGVYALAGNAKSQTWPAVLLYKNQNQLHDVTSGSNGSCTYTIECTAWQSYDGPTGVGTPNGLGGF